jgi:multidrug efflux pump
VDFSKFFIDRPIFAAVLSIVIIAAGLIAIPILPISEYPEVSRRRWRNRSTALKT